VASPIFGLVFSATNNGDDGDDDDDDEDEDHA
jgi:hypothetical protein